MQMLAWALTGLSFLGVLGCQSDKSTSGLEYEVAQQVGDVMASIDESGGTSSGTLAFYNEMKSAGKLYARHAPSSSFGNMLEGPFALLPKSHAAHCSIANTFSSCSNNVITRTFNGCTVGGATIDGTVTLTWADAANNNVCAATANGHTITRVPNFNLTGPRGGKLYVEKESGATGQILEKTGASTWNYRNDGVRRRIMFGGSTLFDFTTETTGDLNITGNNRAGRILSSSGAGLAVTDNLTNVTCTYAPDNVTWTSNCNCATGGSWAAACSDGKSSTLTINGCGSATLTMDSESTSLTFDRCYSL